VSKLKTFFRLIVPLSTAGLITGSVELCPYPRGVRRGAHGGGNIEGRRGRSRSIYDEVQALNYAGAPRRRCCCLPSPMGLAAGLCNESKGLDGMAAEMTIDVTKTFPVGRPIQARLRYAVEASTY